MSREEWINDIHTGDAIGTLEQMRDDLVNTVVTSPPYFSLRNYQIEGQMGAEDNYKKYIDYLVNMGRELKRVMRDDGSWWLNLGDMYSQTGRGQGTGNFGNKNEEGAMKPEIDIDDDIKRKSKYLMPHRVAIALMDDGWIVRSDVVWHKSNAIPSSAKDRVRKVKEYIFHLTQKPDYWFDLDSIRVPHANISKERVAYGNNPGKFQNGGGDKVKKGTQGIDQVRGGVGKDNLEKKIKSNKTPLNPKGAAPGDVWKLPTETKVHEAHFAVYPEELIEKPIKSSCPPKVCSKCGTPWVREDPDKEKINTRPGNDVGNGKSGTDEDPHQDEHNSDFAQKRQKTLYKLGDFKPDCDCNASPRPGVVLDPFFGSGTTGVVAEQEGRDWIGIDINPDYRKIALNRINKSHRSIDRFF